MNSQMFSEFKAYLIAYNIKHDVSVFSSYPVTSHSSYLLHMSHLHVVKKEDTRRRDSRRRLTGS